MLRNAHRAFIYSVVLACSAQALAAPESFDSEQGRVTVATVAEGLEHPWALAFLPEQAGMLVTERPGRLRIVDSQGRLS